MIVLESPLEAATRKASPIPHASEDALQRLRERRANLLKVESKAAPKIEAQVAIGEVALEYPTARVLDKSVLRWRYDLRYTRSGIFKVPLPKLALINISSPTFYLCRMEHSRQETSLMPSSCTVYYNDILKQLDRATAFFKKSTLSFTWRGLVPDDAKQIIDEAEGFFGHYKSSGGYANEVGNPRIYLLVEAPHEQWTIKNEEKERVRHLDPLILGHRGSDLFMIGSFDPTPIEEYVAAEFTMKELTA